MLRNIYSKLLSCINFPVLWSFSKLLFISTYRHIKIVILQSCFEINKLYSISFENIKKFKKPIHLMIHYIFRLNFQNFSYELVQIIFRNKSIEIFIYWSKTILQRNSSFFKVFFYFFQCFINLKLDIDLYPLKIVIFRYFFFYIWKYAFVYNWFKSVEIDHSHVVVI